MELKAESTVFENASVKWSICTGGSSFMQNGLQLAQFMSFDLHGSTDLCLTAIMQGGKGDHSWQHSQLFRQSMDDKDNFPLEIKLFLD